MLLLITTGTTVQKIAQRFLKSIPRKTSKFRLIIVDTDLEALRETANIVQNDPRVVVIGLGKEVDLEGIRRHADLHHLIYQVIEELPYIPKDLSKGSQKNIGLTLAAFLADLPHPDGILSKIQEVLADITSNLDRNEKIHIFIVGLACGGVGGILPLLIGVLLRTLTSIIPNLDIELHLIWLEVRPEERNSRILANQKVSLELLEVAQKGKFRLEIPEVQGIRELAFEGPIFDYVWFVSEINEYARLDQEELFTKITDFIQIWSGTPLGAAISGRMADLLAVKEREVNGRRRILMSFGIRSLSLGIPWESLAKELCYGAVSEVLNEETEIDTGKIIDLGEIKDSLKRQAIQAVNFPSLRMKIESLVLHEASLARVVLENLLPSVEERIEEAVDRGAENFLQDIEERLDERIHEILRSGAHIRKALRLIMDLFAMVQNHSIPSGERANIRWLQSNLIEAEGRLRSFWGKIRKGKVIDGIVTLLEGFLASRIEDKVTATLQEMKGKILLNLERLRRELDSKLEDLVRFSEGLKLEVLHEKTERSFLEREEIWRLLLELVGLQPSSARVMIKQKIGEMLEKGVALEPLPKEVLSAIEKDLRPIDILRWKANREGKGFETLLKQLVEGALDEATPLVSFDRSVLPLDDPVQTLELIQIPEDLPILQRPHLQVIRSSKDEMTAVRIAVGLPITSLRLWPRLVNISSREDGQGPLIPHTLRVLLSPSWTGSANTS